TISIDTKQAEQYDNAGSDRHCGEGVDQWSADGEGGRQHVPALRYPRGDQHDNGNHNADEQRRLHHRREQAASAYDEDRGDSSEDVATTEQPTQFTAGFAVDDRAERSEPETEQDDGPPWQATPGSGDRTLIPPNTVGRVWIVSSGIACGGHSFPPYRFGPVEGRKVRSLPARRDRAGIMLNGLSTVADMRVLHTSDWHIGRTFHGADLLAEQEWVLGHLVELVETERV